jgi:hypothetical protein
VVLSIDKFEALSKLDSNYPGLEELTQEFDDRVARMQTPDAAAGADAFFGMGAEALGEAALRGARRNRT